MNWLSASKRQKRGTMTKRFATLEALQEWFRTPERHEYEIDCILREGTGFVVLGQKKRQAA